MEKHEGQGGFDQDENFYAIIDYTDGGAPYGITWGEYYDNLYEFTDRDYYFISEVIDGGKVIGITWKEFLVHDPVFIRRLNCLDI